MKSIMCLNEKSITNIPIAIMTEAIITMVALLWSSDHDGQETLLTSSLSVSYTHLTLPTNSRV